VVYCWQCSVEDSSEHVAIEAGELHQDMCLEDLDEDHAGIPLKVTGPVVSYREAVNKESDHVFFTKLRNKHNRLYMKARPMLERFAEDKDKVCSLHLSIEWSELRHYCA